jgi:ADP-ribosylglycohydrolase
MPDIHALIRSTGATFLNDYIWRMGPSQDACEKAGRPKLLTFGKGIAHMPIDDDTNYTIIGMSIVKQNGIDFTPKDVARFWISNVPLIATCTAERAAYRNFTNQIDPPTSATVRNPYREWIGAQIRADFFGYVALARPELAAELAWRDAYISHVGNGIYGEMWVAAMLASAAVVGNPRRVIELGLSEIPANCRLARDVQTILDWHDDGVSYDQACERIHDRWDERNMHHWCHTNANAQIVATALLWGQGDFETAITRSVWPGFDTDCNAATVGSIMGMMLGAEALPEKWTSVMNDTLHTAVAGYNVTSISGTAEEMFELFQNGWESC